MKKIGLCLLLAFSILLISVSSMAAESQITFSDVSFSQEEIKQAKKVEWISDRTFFYYERDAYYAIRFSFKQKDETRIACPCFVEARLENSEGDIVYKTAQKLTNDAFSTWTWDSALYAQNNGIYGTIKIQPDEIIKSKKSEGKLYIKVTLGDGVYFSEKEVEVDELPIIESKLTLPTVPKTISCKSYGDNKEIEITNIRYEFTGSGKTTLNVFITGKMTKSDTYAASSSKIGWRILDDEEYIIDSGTWYLDDLEVGDKFKDKKFTIYNIMPGNYTLELRNII